MTLALNCSDAFDQFLCLKFSLPQRISAIDIQASFEKFYWRLDRTLADDKKELTAATLRSIALNYIDCKSPKPPKPLQRAIKQLKRLNNIVVTKPDKGTGVVIMNKSDYVNLLSQASVNLNYNFYFKLNYFTISHKSTD